MDLNRSFGYNFDYLSDSDECHHIVGVSIRSLEHDSPSSANKQVIADGKELQLPSQTESVSEEVDVTNVEVLRRIEKLAASIVCSLDKNEMPVMEAYPHTSGNSTVLTTSKMIKRFTLNQCRSFTSVLLVAAFCHSLILAKRTTTSREVYYFYVTHFRSQRECDAAIQDLCVILQVPRHVLHLMSSPKGWFCGDVQLVIKHENEDERKLNLYIPTDSDENIDSTTRRRVLLDGRSLPSVHGSPIGSEWLLPESRRNFMLQTVAATFILVIEKEGVYNRLSEDGFYRYHPCILVTGKGFPDFATRAFVHALHCELNLPVRGLADCNPFGVLVLNTYKFSNQQHRRGGVDGGDRYSVPMEWIGLRPSQVSQIMDVKRNSSQQTLPPEVFQKLTSIDEKRLFGTLLKEVCHHVWTDFGKNKRRIQELYQMRKFKIELEALNWLGMDFLTIWLSQIFNSDDEMKKRSSNCADKKDQEEWLQII